MLPPLDPDYLISVHDPAQLDEYAADLLQHLRAIRKDRSSRTAMVSAWSGPPPTGCLPNTLTLADQLPSMHSCFGTRCVTLKPTPRARTGPRVQEHLLPAYIEAYFYDAAHTEEPPLYAVAKHVRKQVKPDWSQEAAEARDRAWRKQRYYRDQVRLNRLR